MIGVLPRSLWVWRVPSVQRCSHRLFRFSFLDTFHLSFLTFNTIFSNGCQPFQGVGYVSHPARCRREPCLTRQPGKLFGNKEMRLLMLGLDAAGKTSMWRPLYLWSYPLTYSVAILYKLKLNQSVTTIPTGVLSCRISL